ncbi:MAG: sensor histidine kinase [Bacillota bacterium]
MEKLLDKSIIFIVSLILYIPSAKQAYMIAPVLAVIIISAYLSFLEDERAVIAAFITYIAACFFIPSLLFFLPVMCYDAILLSRINWIWLLSFLPLYVKAVQPSIAYNWLLLALILAAYIMKHRTESYLRIKEDYHMLRDSTKEIYIKLEKQNKELSDKQDNEISLATLKERNRIARDIHDNVGHLLSRSILQIGALLAVYKDEQANKNLLMLKKTLSEAMDSIRSSVHDLHDESINLRTEIQKLIDGFSFCPAKFEYEVETSPKREIKYCFITITKEALSNIIKHSNATCVIVLVREHPAIYQLVIQDNGTQVDFISEKGIGLKNISHRVAAVGGNINISTDKGFRLFISVPKQYLKGTDSL